MPRRVITAIALALLGAGALAAAPAFAQPIGFGLSFNVPGLSIAVGTPALAPAPMFAPAVVAPSPAWGPGFAPYRPHFRRWVRPAVPVVVRPAIVAVPAPVVLRPRPVVVAVPVARVAVPFYGGY